MSQDFTIDESTGIPTDWHAAIFLKVADPGVDNDIMCLIRTHTDSDWTNLAHFAAFMFHQTAGEFLEFVEHKLLEYAVGINDTVKYVESLDAKQREELKSAGFLDSDNKLILPPSLRDRLSRSAAASDSAVINLVHDLGVDSEGGEA